MITGSKRKAIDLNDEMSGRPMLVKKRTFTYGVLPAAVGNEDTRQACLGNEMASTADMKNASNSLAVKNFQSKLTSFCERHGASFGPAYIAELQLLHSEAISSLNSTTIITAGQRFLSILNQYVQDLQQAAIQQIQLRAQIIRIGASKETVAAMDNVLSQMDRRIVEMGAEMSLLWQELSVLESQGESSPVADYVQQPGPIHQSMRAEIAVL